MKIVHAFIALLFVTAAANAQTKKISAARGNFNRLLNQAHLTFKSPLGAIETPVVKNKEINYHYALKYPKRGLEIRYLVVPFTGKPVKLKPAPAGKFLGSIDTAIIHKFDNYSMKLATNAGGGIKDKNIQMGGFPADVCKKDFGADRVSYWMIPVKNNSFGTSYKFCNMVAIHKDNAGEVYVFYLCNSIGDLTKAFKEIGPHNIYYSLRFK